MDIIYSTFYFHPHCRYHSGWIYSMNLWPSHGYLIQSTREKKNKKGNVKLMEIIKIKSMKLSLFSGISLYSGWFTWIYTLSVFLVGICLKGVLHLYYLAVVVIFSMGTQFYFLFVLWGVTSFYFYGKVFPFVCQLFWTFFFILFVCYLVVFCHFHGAYHFFIRILKKQFLAKQPYKNFQITCGVESHGFSFKI